MNPDQTRYWLVVYETNHPKKTVAVYAADAADLDIFSAINPSQENSHLEPDHASHTEELLHEGGLWDMAQRTNVFFSQSELDYLTQGILRRMVLLTPDESRGFATVHAIPVKEAPPAGERVCERYGIKVWRLPRPMVMKNEDPWKHSGGVLTA